jgi:hypothetical protein
MVPSAMMRSYDAKCDGANCDDAKCEVGCKDCEKGVTRTGAYSHTTGEKLLDWGGTQDCVKSGGPLLRGCVSVSGKGCGIGGSDAPAVRVRKRPALQLASPRIKRLHLWCRLCEWM